MDELEPTQQPELPLQSAQLIDAICEQFEESWRQKAPLHIEDFLHSLPRTERAALLRELLLIEFEYRNRRLDYPCVAEYLERFPDDVDTVHRTFAKAIAKEFAQRLRKEKPCTLDDLLTRHPELLLHPAEFQMLLAVERQKGLQEAGENRSLQPPPRSDEAGTTNPDRTTARLDCPHCNAPVTSSNGPTSHCESCGGRFSLHTEPALSGRQFGAFQLIREVGKGAFGTVYLARDTILGRQVAIKVPRAGILDGSEERFLREAQSAAQLQHAGIVAVHQIGQEGDTVFIVSDYVEGVVLEKYLADRERGLPPREAAELCLSLTEALQHAHSMGVIHRDLKPSNILLDGEMRPRILDFGLAKIDVDEVSMTIEGHILGTPAYMPPEQARGESHGATAQSDLYSLGVVLFELLTRERPFRGDTTALLRQILTVDAPSPRSLNPAVPRDLETICLRCLEKSPEDRFKSAEALAADLRRFLKGEPVLARPISAATRAIRWLRRHPLITSLASLLLIATVISCFFTYESVRLANLYQTQRNKSDAAELDRRIQVADLLAFKADFYQRSDNPGRKLESLAMVAEAASIVRETADDFDEQIGQLRRTALFALSRLDVEQIEQSTIEARMSVSLSSHLENIAIATPEGEVVVRDLEDLSEVWRRPATEFPAWFISTSFSGDGRFLGICYYIKDGGYRSEVWDLERQKNVMDLPVWMPPNSFHPERLLTAYSSPTEVILWDNERRGEFDKIPVGFAARGIRFSPDGKWLAAAHPVEPAVSIVDVSKRTEALRIPYSATNNSLAWSYDSQLLACGTGSGRIHVIKRATGETYADLDGHSGQVILCEFLPSTHHLVSTAVDGKVRLWDVVRKRSALVLPGIDFQVHRSGRSMVTMEGQTLTHWSLSIPDEVRIRPTGLASSTKPNVTNATRSLGVTPDENLVFSVGMDGVTFWNRDGYKVATLEIGRCQTAQFHPHDGDFYTFGPNGLCRWPIRTTNDNRQPHLEIGQGTCVREFGSLAFYPLAACTSQPWMAVGQDSTKRIFLVDPDHPFRAHHFEFPGSGPYGITIDPSGTWLAAGCWGDSTVPVWNLRRHTLARRLVPAVKGESAFSGTAFSPDAKWLVVSTSHPTKSRISIWSTETWQLRKSIERSESAAAAPPAFVHDGTVIAVATAANEITLFDCPSLKERARIENPGNTRLAPIAFDSSGSVLLLASEREYFHEWNLSRLQNNLHRNLVGWDVDLAPKGNIHRARRDWHVTLPTNRLVTNASAKKPPTPADPLVAAGIREFANDSFDEARKQFEAAVGIEPKHLEAHYYLGRVAFAQRDYEKARTQFQMHIERSQQDTDAMRLAAAACQHLGDHTEAVHHLDRLLQIDPKHYVARRMRAESQIALGNANESLSDLAELQRVDGDDPDVGRLTHRARRLRDRTAIGE